MLLPWSNCDLRFKKWACADDGVQPESKEVKRSCVRLRFGERFCAEDSILQPQAALGNL